MKATRTAMEENKGYEGEKNNDGGAKRGKKKRGGIDGFAPKEEEGDNYNNTKCKYMYILSFFQNI